MQQWFWKCSLINSCPVDNPAGGGALIITKATLTCEIIFLLISVLTFCKTLTTVKLFENLSLRNLILADPELADELSKSETESWFWHRQPTSHIQSSSSSWPNLKPGLPNWRLDCRHVLIDYSPICILFWIIQLVDKLIIAIYVQCPKRRWIISTENNLNQFPFRCYPSE